MKREREKKREQSFSMQTRRVRTIEVKFDSKLQIRFGTKCSGMSNLFFERRQSFEGKKADERLGSQQHMSYSHIQIGALLVIPNALFVNSKYAQSLSISNGFCGAVNSLQWPLKIPSINFQFQFECVPRSFIVIDVNLLEGIELSDLVEM